MSDSWRAFFILFTSLLAGVAHADDGVRIAVAANFKAPLQDLTVLYSETHPTKFVISSGASGVLYAQIRAGAPFDLFFSADTARPAQLERDGATVTQTRFVYAVGKLVLWTPGRPIVADLRQTLSTTKVRSIAIANPAAAPYGAAAEQVLKRLGLTDRFKLIRGENIGQTFQFLASGNADAGFIARSQIREYERANNRSLAAETIAIDSSLHDPIEQAAVLLQAGKNNAAARDFLQFVQSEQAQRLIAAAGYQSTTWISPNCQGCKRDLPVDAYQSHRH